jgi:hypothetical protein
MYVWNTTLVFLGQKGFDFVVLRRPDASLVRKFRNFPPLRVGGGLLRTTFGLSCGPTVAEHDNNEALCDRYSSSHQLELVLYINVPIGAVGLLAGRGHSNDPIVNAIEPAEKAMVGSCAP